MRTGRAAAWLFTGALAVAPLWSSAAKVEFFEDIDAGPEELTVEHERYLAFGEVMYDYYRQHHFSATNLLLVNQERELFDEDTDYAELVLGDLYVSYGLPEKAGSIFNRLLEKDIISRVRAETWLHKADLHYREGRYSRAAEILDSDKINGLNDKDDAKRRLMLANTLMAEGDFTGAVDYLYSVPAQTTEGRFATYNMGVALLRAGHRKQGISLLSALIESSGDDDQSLALMDRAALAVGLSQLKAGNLDDARQALSHVRIDGPFSEDALLTLGLVNYRRGDVKRALPLWLETVRRNTSHPSVQEALMLAPRAYEELGAYPQALAGYQFAADKYREELTNVQRAVNNIQTAGWLAELLPKKHTSDLVLLNVDDRDLASGDEVAYLYKLFAGNSFAQRFQHYRQLHQIKRMLEYWDQSLPALVESYELQKRQLTSGLPLVREKLSSMLTRQEQLALVSEELKRSLPKHLDLTHPEDLGSAEQAIMWQKVEALSERYGQQPSHTATRLNRVRGLLLWQIANQAAEQRQKQEADSNRLIEDSNMLAQRVAAVRRQVRDASLRVKDNLGTRLIQEGDRIAALKTRTEESLDALEASMQEDAIALLQKTQRRLADQLAEAHLAVARLQDSSLSRRQHAKGQQ